MAVTSCTLTRQQQPTSFDELNLGRYSLKYEVVTDGVMGHRNLGTAAQASSPHALPLWGDSYSYQGDVDDIAFAQNFQIESREGHQNRYYITVNYSPLETGDSGQFAPNPMNRPIIVWADREVYTRIIEQATHGNNRDANATAIVNLAGTLYDILPEHEVARGVLVVEKNVATLLEVLQYQRFLWNAVNSITWQFQGVLFPPRTVLAREVAAGPPITEANFTYYHLVFRFALAAGDTTLNASGGQDWDDQILERGYQWYKKNAAGDFLRDGNGRKIRFPEKIGSPEPENLAEDGTLLPDGQLGIFTKWRIRREVDFNLLNL